MGVSGPGKDIAGKVVDFLREKGGRAVISLIKDAVNFGCVSTGLGYSLHRLIGVGVVRTSNPIMRGSHKPIELILSDEFREGDSWRQLLKRKSKKVSGGQVEAGTGSDAKAPNGSCQNKEYLTVKRAYLQELVTVYENLKALQEVKKSLEKENATLRSTEKELRARVRELEGEVERKKVLCRQLRDDVDTLDSRLRTLRIQTSQQPTKVGVAERKLNFDDSGAVILPKEGLPDRVK